MSVVAVCSAKGAPGTTMAAQALAAVWPRPVALVDADPAGGDLLWRCRGVDGEPLDPDRGLLSLAAAARRDADETTLGEHLQETAVGTPVLVGITSQDQLTGIGSVWTQLPSLLAAHDTDVLIDCGRVTAGSASLPVALRADAMLFVVRPDIEGVAHLRSRLLQLRSSLRPGDGDGTPVLIAVATSYRDRDSAPHLQQLLEAEGIGGEVVGIVAHDPKAAQVFSSTRVGNPAKSLLARSAKVVAQRVASVSTPDRAGSV
ncbi:ParA family protein [Nocardioides jishulii]|uniref:ParA family protein n=1 Tax=Nocardioides jishulii TaxID=2575440 RepID=A0A4U2YTQ8_9ACTN|nr:ParA family protein [Nocardioides jishulii]QCX28298.1 ParA family protein [Nocardioides jishulii]TKI64809.1 ParA family protein [Nocardioides jishulii]